MPLELTALVLAGLLQVLQIALMAVPANIELGQSKTLGPRDRDKIGGDMRDLLSSKTARLHRAMENHFEGLILFSIACVTVAISEASTAFTALCAFVYLAARVVYVPAYVFGWVPWRTVVWTLGYLATAAMLVAVLL